MKEEYKFVFVVLVYRNLEVLKDFFYSLKLKDCKIIIVESHYDDKTSEKCKEVAYRYDAIYIKVENKGYGYGNNVGIRYALKHFSFDFLVVSNSDIIIENIENIDSIVGDMKTFVIAPLVERVRDGKKQNPNIVRYSHRYYSLLKYAYERNSKIAELMAHVISRLQRELFFLKKKISKKNLYKIFSPHGSFIIFSYEAITQLHPLFNEKMFLYNEELYLGLKCDYKKIPIYFTSLVSVKHLEGASTPDKEKEFKRCKDSFLELDNWRKQI